MSTRFWLSWVFRLAKFAMVCISSSLMCFFCATVFGVSRKIDVRDVKSFVIDDVVWHTVGGAGLRVCNSFQVGRSQMKVFIEKNGSFLDLKSQKEVAEMEVSKYFPFVAFLSRDGFQKAGERHAILWGWPFECFAVLDNEFKGEVGGLKNSSDFMSATKLASTLFQKSHTNYVVFLINIIVFCIVLVFCFSGFKAGLYYVVRRRRKKEDRCIVCGYPRMGIECCPECGSTPSG